MISVCLCTYNGEKTIERQLVSILPQLTISDEIIIVDDASTDRTVKIVKEILNQYPIPFEILINERNLGAIFSFEKAIQEARGDYLYLSDQDDQWFPIKVATIQKVFYNEKATLVMHNAAVVDGMVQIIDPSWNHFRKNPTTPTVLNSLYRNNATGAMMAFKKELKKNILPFPKDLQMHDQWIFLMAKKNKKKVITIEEPLMNYVRHGGNVTGMNKRSKKEMLKGRLIMLKCYMMKKKSEKEV